MCVIFMWISCQLWHGSMMNGDGWGARCWCGKCAYCYQSYGILHSTVWFQNMSYFEWLMDPEFFQSSFQTCTYLNPWRKLSCMLSTLHGIFPWQGWWFFESDENTAMVLFWHWWCSVRMCCCTMAVRNMVNGYWLQWETWWMVTDINEKWNVIAL